MAACTISNVSDVGMLRISVCELLYCGKSSRKRFVVINTVIALARQPWPRSLFAELEANDTIDDFNESISVTISPKLRLVQILCF